MTPVRDSRSGTIPQVDDEDPAVDDGLDRGGGEVAGGEVAGGAAGGEVAGGEVAGGADGVAVSPRFGAEVVGVTDSGAPDPGGI
ncbi:hypothetical protein GCM10022204_12620 [Microlunatus aurantiacus]|uniref:Uncharacterized protein n=1 Tax=Microlunatus aurantiacus TaxID=446786 RepID=A0ABP7CXS1_9ACTN